MFFLLKLPMSQSRFLEMKDFQVELTLSSSYAWDSSDFIPQMSPSVFFKQVGTHPPYTPKKPSQIALEKTGHC